MDNDNPLRPRHRDLEIMIFEMLCSGVQRSRVQLIDAHVYCSLSQVQPGMPLLQHALPLALPKSRNKLGTQVLKDVENVAYIWTLRIELDGSLIYVQCGA